MKKLHFIPLIILSLIACEKVIEVDLNTSDPKTVIDASLCAQDSVHLIFLSKSGRFTDAEGLARVSGAIINISDLNGAIATFTEFDSGIYYLENYPLITGNTYNLEVINGDETITASSILHPKIEIDSLYFAEDEFGGPPSEETLYNTRIIFQDPGGVPNYYREVLTVNDTLDNVFRVANDDLTDGNERDLGYFQRRVREGDNVEVELWMIDQEAFNYFNTLDDIASGSGFVSATPYNPISNLSGGLGNFTVYHRSTISGTVTP